MFALLLIKLRYKIKKSLREKGGIILFWMKLIKIKILKVKEHKFYLSLKVKEDFL